MDATSDSSISVFISYRRRDQPLFAELLAERLRRSGCRAFLDVDTIALGEDWRRSIQEALTDSHYVVVLIGSDWQSDRLSDPVDVVAYELRVAHKFQRIIIPVLLGDATLPAPVSVPEDLAWFTQLNAFSVLDPPDHQPYLHSLVTQLGSSPSTAIAGAGDRPEAAHYSIPVDGEKLTRIASNVGFRRVRVPSDTRRISLSRSAEYLWVATNSEIQVGKLPGFHTLAAMQDASVEGLVAGKDNQAALLVSSVGYHAPDSLTAAELKLHSSSIVEVRRTHLGYIFGADPVVSLSPESSHLAVLFPDQRASWGTSRPASPVVASLKLNKSDDAIISDAQGARVQCFGSTFESIYALSGPPVILRQISTATGEVISSTRLPLGSASGLAYQPLSDTVLATDGATLLEVAPADGTIREILSGETLAIEQIAIDPTTGLVCVVEGQRCRLLSGASSKSATEVGFGARSVLAASCASGSVALLAGNPDWRDPDAIVLLATDVIIDNSNEVAQI